MAWPATTTSSSASLKTKKQLEIEIQKHEKQLELALLTDNMSRGKKERLLEKLCNLRIELSRRKYGSKHVKIIRG